MVMHIIPCDCAKCRTPQDKLFPLCGGICAKCLVENFTLQEALKATCYCLHEEIYLLYKAPEETIINIQVAFVHGREFKGKASKLTVPNCDMSVKDIRGYLLKCAQSEDGTANDQEIIKDLLEKCGIDTESIKNDPIEIRQSVMGCFMEKDLPSCPIVERTHVLFLHPTPLG